MWDPKSLDVAEVAVKGNIKDTWYGYTVHGKTGNDKDVIIDLRYNSVVRPMESGSRTVGDLVSRMKKGMVGSMYVFYDSNGVGRQEEPVGKMFVGKRSIFTPYDVYGFADKE